MPEGHLIHWLARRHRDLLAGGPVVASSPQGRFVAEAKALDGAVLEEAEAVGKHLLYRWDRPEVLHVHLGQAGKFLEREAGKPPIPQARLTMDAVRGAVDLVAPARCELLDEAGADRLRDRLGPDPLDEAADPEPARRTVSSSARPIGALLLDQSVLSGVGNVLRAEVLNMEGIDPQVPGRDLGPERFDRLWARLLQVMRDAADRGSILTVPGATDQADGRYVYKQERCRRCGTPVETSTLAARTMYACPACQPAA